MGAGIFLTVPNVAKGSFSAWGVLAIWLAGGLISLCGALGYAELASAYPKEGGDYVYMTRAYGPWAGFMFGWTQLTVVRPGDIVVMAFAFATYARALYDPFTDTAFPYGQQIYSCAVVIGLTVINILGVRKGKWTQNLLTIAKVLGLIAVIALGIAATKGAGRAVIFDPLPVSVAMILVLFTYGGWNEMAYVAAEVRNPKRNIVRALVAGTAAVTVLYLLANAAFLYALGYDGMAVSEAVAVDTVSTVFPDIGARLIAVLICISALGAVNGLIFTGARISYAVGADHRAFRFLGRWHPRLGTPVRSLLLQGAIAVVLIVALGSLVEAVLYTAAAVYAFFLATSVAVIVLRYKEPDVERPYRVTGYPFTTILFCGVCAFLIYSAVLYKPEIALVACGILLLGLPIYWLTARPR